MAAELATLGEDATAEDIGRLMEARGIRRVPVVKDGRLVGIVSRADLLRAVLAPKPQPEALGDDAAILRAVLSAMRDQPWADGFWVFPDVAGGRRHPLRLLPLRRGAARPEGARGGNPRREARRGQDGADADPGADADLIRHDADRHRRGARTHPVCSSRSRAIPHRRRTRAARWRRARRDDASRRQSHRIDRPSERVELDEPR